MPDNIDQAASLAAWLIKDKGTKRNVSIIIGCNKYKVPFHLRPVVSKRTTQIIKSKNPQLELL